MQGWTRMHIWTRLEYLFINISKGTMDPRVEFSLGTESKKSKWKFKMAFAMKGGGLEGVSFAIKLFWKMIFLKTI